ncbi:hypothetical protein L208DRAFT_86920 [Tricholoma matsutake]|nr:hypothetical protein L208DRAFT_86920 [Tricholoma matsutake 945]
MLKRQRPVSPPPSIPTIPLVDDPPFEMAHHSKRRRVLPPVLDGQMRGWGRSDDEDEDEEEIEDYKEDTVDATNLDSSLSGYKSANSVLSELHTLHRRRHFSSSLPNPQLSWPQTMCLSSQAHDKNGKFAQLRPSQSYIERRAPEPTDELLCVTERYEDTNRLLGSLFLSRRRQLGSSENYVDS